MTLSRATLYAIGAVLQLDQAKPQVPLYSVGLTAAGQMPEQFHSQILRRLVLQGILRSDDGDSDEYALARALESISLLDIIEAIDGPIQARLPGDQLLPEECLVRLLKALGHIADEKRSGLRRISLAHIAPLLP